MNKEEIAYMAGLFDGEGSIHMTGRNTGATVTIAFTNTDEQLCNLFSRHWGGNVSSTQPKKGRQLLRWYRSGKQAKTFLEDIKKYAIAKQDLITLALQFIDLTGYSGRTISPDILKQRHILSQAIYSKQKNRLLL